MYRAITIFKPLHPALSVRVFISRQHGLVDFHDRIPELGVLVFEHENYACGLGVEGARYVEDGLGDELFDAGVGDGGGGAKLVLCSWEGSGMSAGDLLGWWWRRWECIAGGAVGERR